MIDILREHWLLAVLALVVAVLVAWWVFAASRRTRVELGSGSESGQPARRNQALIDAPPAAPPPPIPPVTPEGLAGIGEAIAAAAVTAPPPAGDDLTRIKGVGPRLAQRLAELGVTGFAQIAAWNEADIDRIDGQLGRFQGRIRRDDWPAQARLLGAGDTAEYEAKFGRL